MWSDPITLSAFVAAFAGLLTAIAGLVTAIRGHAKAKNAVNEVAAVTEELRTNGNGNGGK